MPDQKTIVTTAFKFIVFLFGMAMLIGFLAEYSGYPHSRNYIFLITSLLLGCAAISFGSRKIKPAGSEEPVSANSLQRFANYFVDIVFCNMIVVTIIASSLNFFAKLAQASSPYTVSFVLGIIVLPVYYFLFEFTLQRTPGKFLTGTVVATADLNRPDAKSILARSFIRLIPFEPLSIFAKKGLWHDSWSKTHVIIK